MELYISKKIENVVTIIRLPTLINQCAENVCVSLTVSYFQDVPRTYCLSVTKTELIPSVCE